MGKKRRKAWEAASPCLFWRKRNKVAFENEGYCTHWVKPTFISNLWSWVNVYSVGGSNSYWIFDLAGL